MLWIPVGVIGLLGVYSLIVFIVNRRARAARMLGFVSREQGDVSEWFRENFGGAGLDEQECVKVLEPVAKAIGCEVTQLRSDDAFLGSLRFRGMRWLGIDGDDPLEDYLEYELSLVIGETRADAVQERAEHLSTLRDFVSAIGSAGRP
jgi:hypothetical protein